MPASLQNALRFRAGVRAEVKGSQEAPQGP